jgi:hypothetical protein
LSPLAGLRLAAAFCVAALCITPPAHAQRAAQVACDLVDEQMAAFLLKDAIAQHTPDREVQVKGGVSASSCVFVAGRSNLRVQLFQYPNAAAAAGALRKMTSAQAGPMTFSKEKGLGDEAYWWRIGQGAHGYLVRKGVRVVVLDARSQYAVAEKDARAQLQPGMPAVMGKL